MAKPAKLGLQHAARTRFDEFQLLHMYQAPIAHGVVRSKTFKLALVELGLSRREN